MTLCLLRRPWEYAHLFVDSVYSLVISQLGIKSPRVQMFSAFLVFHPWNVWPVDNTSCSILLLHDLGSSWGKSWLVVPHLFEGFLAWISVKVLRLFVVCCLLSRFAISDGILIMKIICACRIIRGPPFFSDYSLLVAVENTYKRNMKVLR